MPRLAIKLSPEEDRAFQEFIEENSGLHLEEHAIRSLAEVVGERIKAVKVESPHKYLNFLRFHPQGKEEFPQLLNLLTIKETYFFRNQPQFKVLREKILPEIIKRKTKERLYHSQLRLWSAGCSSGEEPYSLAMSIREVISNLKDWEIEILATDISPEALEKAERGIYGKRAVKYTDKVYLDKYFKRLEGKYYLKDEIRGMVKFLYHNLVNDVFPEKLDLIFCRNVTIYFKRPLTEKIIGKFYQSLNEGGYLIIGHSETLYGMSSGFELVNLKDAFVYRKVSPVRRARPVEKNVSNGVRLKEKVKEWQSHLPSPSLLSPSFPGADSSSPAGLAVGERRPTDVPFDAETSFGQALGYYRKRDYLKALELCQKALPKLSNPARAYHLLGCIYADQGEYEKSKEPLEKALEYDSLLFDAYFKLGIVCIKLKKPEEAIANLKKTVFLSPDFALAHFYLANLYRDFKEDNKARREYENTLKALNSNSKAELDEFGGGFAKETLTRTCQIYLERLRKKGVKIRKS